MVRFGPSGNDESFYAEGYTKTLQAFNWIKNKGLDIYEYSLGNGITLKPETAKQLGIEAVKNNIEVSLHAPYFINFANPSMESRQKSIDYVLRSLDLLNLFQGKKCVIHSGSAMMLCLILFIKKGLITFIYALKQWGSILKLEVIKK